MPFETEVTSSNPSLLLCGHVKKKNLWSYRILNYVIINYVLKLLLFKTLYFKSGKANGYQINCEGSVKSVQKGRSHDGMETLEKNVGAEM